MDNRAKIFAALLMLASAKALALTASNFVVFVQPGGTVTLNFAGNIATTGNEYPFVTQINGNQTCGGDCAPTGIATPHGTVTTNGDPSVTSSYTAAANYSGDDVFTYQVTDIYGGNTATATVTAHVLPSSSLQAVNDSISIPVNPGGAAATAINILANDTYNPAYLSVTPPQSTTPANAGTLAYDATTHQILFTPTAHYRGTATFTYQLSDGANTSSATVTVDIGISHFATNPYLNPEEQRAATVLDSACTTASGALERSCAVLEGLSDRELQQAIDQILPRQVPAQMQSALLQQSRQLGILRDRLREIHDGSRGLDVAGLNVRLYDNSAALGQALQSALTGTGSAGDDQPFADSNWGLFLTGRIHHGKIDNRGTQKGFDFRDDILTGGIDYRFGSKAVLGSALGYSDSSNTINGSSGDLAVRSWMLSLYGNYYPTENLYIDWIAGYTYNAYSGDRRIQFGSINDHATFDNKGKQYSADASVGYDWHTGGWEVGPYLRGSYVHSFIDGYTEADTAGLALHVNAQQMRSIETALGTRITYAWPHSHGVLIPGFDIEYTHQWQTDNRLIEAQLAAAPASGTFGVATTALDNNYYNVGVSLTNIFIHGRTAFIRYQTVIDRNNVRDDALEAGFRMEF